MMKSKSLRGVLLALGCTVSVMLVASPPKNAAWVPDLGNGSYKNPVLFADYSDPDAIQVNGDYYLISSSFNSAPGIPVLHSRDLVNWTIINHVFTEQKPRDVFVRPQHGNGCWAPAIRYHGGEYWIFYPDPDFGIYMTKAKNPAGKWSNPVLMLPGKGIIDPCPFWDDNGKAYLIHGWAKSRAGFNNVLTLCPMSPDGTHVLGKGRVIIDGNKLPHYHTLEGPKMYKRNGYYYVFAPAGGVPTGWQSVFRSRTIEGPYEDRIVMEQGDTPINGPHQGAWVETPGGQNWFLHFQDRGPYGRVVLLEPMKWVDGWPVIGRDPDGDGIGEPVIEAVKPEVGSRVPVAIPQTTDEFSERKLGLQWQWSANWKPEWYSLSERPGFLRLKPELERTDGVAWKNLWSAPNLLLQKFPGPAFTVTSRLVFEPRLNGERSGLIIFGMKYAWIGLEKVNGRVRLVESVCNDAMKGNAERVVESIPYEAAEVYLRVTVGSEADCHFAYSLDGKNYHDVGKPFIAVQGRWVGAKVGLFAARTTTGASDPADYDFFRVTGSE